MEICIENTAKKMHGEDVEINEVEYEQNIKMRKKNMKRRKMTLEKKDNIEKNLKEKLHSEKKKWKVSKFNITVKRK